MSDYDSSNFVIGLGDSKRFKCCNHPDRPARLPSHVLCAECFIGLDAKMTALAPPSQPRNGRGRG